MYISTKLLRAQVAMLKPITNSCTIEVARNAQARLGELMAGTHKSKVVYSPKIFKEFIGEWIAPKSQLSDNVILYLHGGGYVAGDIDYAKGFGTILAAKNNIRVFCSAYRLAPEYPYPAALDDALESYNYLLAQGYSSNKIFLCGESAGGGLIYALALKLRELSIPLPAGLIAISPWTDLTLSSKAYEQNRDNDPSLTKERLAYYASLYAENASTSDYYLSPLFADLTGMPPSLIFAGRDEILLGDAVRMNKRLGDFGCSSTVYVERGMWHAYILYGMKEASVAHNMISEFLTRDMAE